MVAGGSTAAVVAGDSTGVVSKCVANVTRRDEPVDIPVSASVPIGLRGNDARCVWPFTSASGNENPITMTKSRTRFMVGPPETVPNARNSLGTSTLAVSQN
jgi:hypothetical protein